MSALQRERIDETGIGLAGIDGLWWLPACGPFVLPRQVASHLADIGAALFAFYDVVAALYGTAAGEAGGLNRLLRYKVPPALHRSAGHGRVLALRPDFQLVPVAPGSANGPAAYRPAVTELEMCPSAHGFAHAMQVGYGLAPDLVNSFLDLLDGRELRIVCSARWSEFLFEQLAFCRAVSEAGGRATLFLDGSLSLLAEEVRHGHRWQPPLFGIAEKPAHWADDLPDRIRKHGFTSFIWPDGSPWPEEAAAAVVFRFGYLDCFTPAATAQLARWQAAGATFLNPAHFYLDSKVLMAAFNLPLVRRRLAAVDPSHVALLERALPETVLLMPASLGRIVAEKDSWVVKYAAFDGAEQAWGGRSIAFGSNHSGAEWRRLLDDYAALPWPVVAQRATPSAVVDIAYLDHSDTPRRLAHGRTRLRAFLLRHHSHGADTATACGAHLTVSAAGLCVAEATDTVQAPVFFADNNSLLSASSVLISVPLRSFR
jgi:hypothetical protein